MTIQKRISQFIQSQFPEIYREQGELFVLFTTAYYEWMEEAGNPIGEARNLLDYRDIDRTLEEFLIHFKNKYLQNIQYSVQSNQRLLTKHSLELYRAKGTDRAVDLFFKQVFGTNVQIHWPGDRILRPSDNEWVVPKYFEIQDTDRARELVGSLITGLTSGATAFATKLIRRRTSAGIYRTILSVSNIVGEFELNEVLIKDQVHPDSPYIIGSVNDVVVTVGGSGFNVGDEVQIISSTNDNAVGYVNAIRPRTSEVTFDFISGGFGYTLDDDQIAPSQPLLSDYTLRVNNLSGSEYWRALDYGYEPITTIDFEDATGSFRSGEEVFTNEGSGRILSVTQSADAGSLIISRDTADFSDTGQILSSNVTATIVNKTDNDVIIRSYTDVTNLRLRASTSITNIVSGDLIEQGNARGTVTSFSLGVIYLENIRGVFNTADPLRVRRTGENFGISDIETDVSINVESGTLIGTGQPRIVINGAEATIDTAATANTHASYSISLLDNTEQISLNTDLLADYVNVPLAAVAYGFPANPSANMSSTIGDTLSFANVTIGSISSISPTSPGSNYGAPPVALPVNPWVTGFDKRDFLFYVSDAGSFMPGERITQGSAVGQVISANSSVIEVRRLQFEDKWEEGSTVTGTSSGATALLNMIADNRQSPRIGQNALIDCDVATALGSIQSIRIDSSGFGYRDGQTVTITSSTSINPAQGIVIKGTTGKSPGYFKTRKGFLSDQIYLFDGDYHQEYSYDVKSNLSFEQYATSLKKVLHVAGTKLFGSILIESKASEEMWAEATVRQIEDPDDGILELNNYDLKIVNTAIIMD